MDTIKKLCQGQNAVTRRRILAAYYTGVADAIKSPPKRQKDLPAMLRNQAD